MTSKQPQITQVEAAVLMRHRQRDRQEAMVARETIFAPAAISEMDDRNLAELIGRRIVDAPGYSLVFMRRDIPRGPRRDIFVNSVERTSGLEAGIGFALLFPSES